MTLLSDLKPGVIVRVVRKGSLLRGRYAIVDAALETWKHEGANGVIFMMPPLASVRIADGDLTGDSFGLPLDWIEVVAVPPAWAAKLRRQAYGLDKPLRPGASPVPAKAHSSGSTGAG